MASAFRYPVALDVRGRKCVIVGGGAVGARKAVALLDAGADVTLITPEVRDESLRELIRAGGVSLIDAMFTPAHLDHALLAVAATDRPDVNASVAEAARARGVLLNLAADTGDGEDAGDFATMATVRRGDLVAAVTTGGAGPALTARLRRELDSRFGPEWADYVSLLGEARAAAKTLVPDARARAAALRRLAERDSVRELLARGDAAGARREAWACLS